MLGVLAADVQLQDYAFDCYGFPTSLFRIPLLGRRAGIREISDGLDTYLRTYHSDKKEIILVGHSLGGVIARFYVLESVKSRGLGSIRGVILFAVPNSGAGLASVSNFFSWRHHHAAQLCKGSDFLDGLNRDWVREHVEEKLDVMYVVGGTDAIVAKESSAGYIGSSNVATLINHGHRSIIKPDSPEDIRYKVLKDFVLSTLPINKTDSENKKQLIVGDPLFDVYSLESECYYIFRDVDKSIRDAAASGHLWVDGASGVGKTAAIKRFILQAGWRYQHIMLASFVGLSPINLLREICNDLLDRAGMPDTIVPSNSSLPNILRFLRTAVASLSGAGTLAVIIEEIPLNPGVDYEEFLDAIYYLAIEPEHSENNFRIVWMFSSINSVRQHVRKNRPKYFERMQFLSLERWSELEILSLAMMLNEKINLDLNEEQVGYLTCAATGSPRFVKTVLRRLRNNAAGQATFTETLALVSLEMTNVN